MKQYVIYISVSHHCPLVIKYCLINWGHKFFRYTNAGHIESDFAETVKTFQNKYEINGNELWILKEKMKISKQDLKEQNKQVFGHINRNKKSIVLKINELNIMEEENALDEQGRLETQQLFTDLQKMSFRQEMILKQKSKSKWLRAGLKY